MKNTTKTKLWKIYFWVLIVISFPTYLWQGFSRFWEIVDLTLFLIAVCGLFAFIWRKTIFSRLVWKINFFIHVAWNIFYLYILPMPEQVAKITEFSEMSHFFAITSSLIFYTPLFFALYLYGFKFPEKNN